MSTTTEDTRLSLMSSSKKKKAVTARCAHCGNHFLIADISAHTGGGSSTRAIASPSISTPPSHHHKVSSPHRSTARNAPRRAESGDTGSGASTPTNPIISCAYESDTNGLDNACTYPHVRTLVGARLTLDKSSQREAELPMEFFGWERRHVALMNPETIGQLGALPRSVAVLIIHPRDRKSGNTDGEIITLWPSQQIPQIRIGLPAALESLINGNAVNLLLVPDDFIRPLHTVTLQLMATESVVTASFLERLQALAHFPYYLKSYLSNCYMAPEIPVMVHFYTKKLVFRVLNAKECQETSLPEAELAQMSLTEEDRKSKINNVYRITANTKIHVQWEREDEEDLR